MSATREERLAYARGYNRANSAASKRAQKCLDIAKGYRERLRDYDTARTCDACARWTRGCERCLWGFCNGGFEWGVEGAAWVDTPIGARTQQIVTHENFGCINWLPKP